MLQTIVLLLQPFGCVLIPIGFGELETGVAHVDFTCLDVIWADYAHAASQAGLVQVCCVFILLVEDQKLGHDTVNVDVQRMVGSPVVIQDL